MLDIRAFRQTPSRNVAANRQLFTSEELAKMSAERMAIVDAMPAEFRALVHEHGLRCVHRHAIASHWSFSLTKQSIAREREAWAREMLDLSDLGL